MMTSTSNELDSSDAASEQASDLRIGIEPLLKEIETNLELLRLDDAAGCMQAVLSLQKTLRLLLVEASVLGLPRIAKLSRCIYRCLELAKDRYDHGMCDALVQSLEVLLKLGYSTGSSQCLPVSSVLGLLKGVFGINDSELLSPLDRYHVSRRNTNGDRGLHDEGFASHLDTSIYSSSILDALDRCAEEESWTVAQLASLAEDLACETDRIKPAHKLMNVMRNHRFFRFVDRLCVAGLVHGSNQLTVVDSCISQRMRAIRDENPMPRGYSCFVNPRGSLFQMRPGVLRVFDDTSRVLESFVKQGKPPQRSIAHIADTGLRSGLCLAIGRADRVQGFLFMNSLEADYFKEVTVRFAPLLSLFSLLGTVALDAAGFHVETGTDSIESQLPEHSTEFRPAEFETLLKRTMDLRSRSTIEVSVKYLGSHRFLYLPRTIVRQVVELLDRLNRPAQDAATALEISVQIDGETVRLSWEHSVGGCVENAHAYVRNAIDCVRAEFREVPVQLEIHGSCVSVRFPVEPVFEGIVDSNYSVAF